ncbi:MAG: hypothetical protein KAU46_10200 [Candidatus Aminicenantes bacterium]|nr:hypothetical protein [Candidatus Aminicenantes bacterium]
MASKGQLTGMRGVYLVASELSRLGFIASPTSRSASGADILVTDQICKSAYSVQVKTNARTFNFWLLSQKSKEQVSDTHIYALVNIRKNKEKETIEYYIVPSKVVSKKTIYSKSKNSEWYAINLKDVQEYHNKWSLFEK